MSASQYGSDDLAKAMFTSLLEGKSFNLPPADIDDGIFKQPDGTGPLFEPVPSVTIDDLTTGVVGGSGVFDRLMVSLSAQLKSQFNEGRLTGGEYTKAYVGMIQAALQAGVQFLLGKDQAHWQALMIQQQAQTAQIEKVKARVELETARLSYTRAAFEALTMEANYALSKLKLATEDVTFSNLQKQGFILDLQKTAAELDNAAKDFTNTYILPIQRDLLTEQSNAARAQTADTRFDGTNVFGSVGKQKDLYSQQIESYKRDTEVKISKIFSDAWTIQKTQDEGILPPVNFTNASLDRILTVLRGNGGMGL